MAEIVFLCAINLAAIYVVIRYAVQHAIDASQAGRVIIAQQAKEDEKEKQQALLNSEEERIKQQERIRKLDEEL